MSELPKGWIEAKFTDFLDVQGGTQPPKSNFFEAYKDGLVRLLQIRDFSSDDKAIYIQDSHKWRKCDEKDVLIARYGASLGRILTGKCGAYNVALAKVVFSNDKFDRKFIIYLLKTPFFQDPLSSTSRSAQNGFNKEDLDRIFLPIAPLNEQRRIVAKLDSLFARSRLAREELERIGGLCDRYRQAVLSAATSGELSEDWQNTEIQTVAKIGTGSTPLKSNSNYYSHTGTPWITSAATGRPFVDSASDFVTESAISDHRLKKYPKGTLLVAMYGEGKTRGQVTELRIEATINQACAAIVVDESLALKGYVRLSLQANYLEMRELAEGGNQPNLNLSKIKSFPLFLPPLHEQQEIIQRVEKLFNAIAQIEQQSKKALKLCDRLDQSILTKAFSGKLVPQDPTDEPAEVLLDRIRSEKQDPPKAKRKKTS